MKVSIVIPTLNSISMVINDCIGTFEKFHGKGHEIIVVDDGSDASTCQQLAQFCSSRGYTFLHNEVNSGFSKTVNRGISAASGDIVVLLNNDIQFIQPILEPLVEAFKADEKIGIVGALLFYPHGTIQHGGVIWLPGTYNFTHRAWHRQINDMPEVTHKSHMISVTGALYAIRKEMVGEIGKLKEDYFISCEDTEYSLRAWHSGWKVFYEPAIRAIHAEGGTRGRTDQEKLIKGRQWYIKELQTMEKFGSDLLRMDLNGIQAKVNAANMDMLRRVAAQSTASDPVVHHEVREEKVKPLTEKSGKRIAIRRTGALGDVLLTTGVIRRIKELYPDCSVSVATQSPEIFRNNPHVDRVAGSIFDIASDEYYDLDLVYEKSPKKNVVAAYAQAVFGDDAVGDMRPHLYSNDNDFNSMAAKMHGFDFSRERVLVVHAARSWENRTWPREKWLEVVRALSNQMKVIVVGRGGDFTMDMYSNVYNMVDRFNIFEIRELLKKAVAFVGMDSGIFHVAQTTDVPCVGLFTVANPAYRVTRARDTISLVPKSDCRFCLHEQQTPVTFVDCNWKSGPDRFKCLGEIKPDDVINAVRAASHLL